MKLKAILYDLDGTIIDSIALHREAWVFAANKFGINLKPQTLIDIRGMEGSKAARLIAETYCLSSKEKERIILKIKRDYLAKSYDQVKVFPGFLETADILQKSGLQVLICTTMTKKFVKMIPQLKSFTKKIVWREMYDQAKPSAQPLLKTAAIAQVDPAGCAYIGDTYNDYLSAKSAGMEFFYFNPPESESDPRLKRISATIKKHSDIIKKMQK
jgi:beta-phosphoglucomutase-like phosphatase (HAD superfamily)